MAGQYAGNGKLQPNILVLQGLRAMTKKQKYDKISEKKLSTPVEVLCKVNENEHWAKFGEYLGYCKNLKFEQRPEYNFLRHLFRKLFTDLKYQTDYVFDWNKVCY